MYRFLSASLLALTAASASATPVIDQSFLGSGGSNFASQTSGASPTRVFQTVTAGITGLMTQIDIWAVGTFSNFNVVATSGGQPTTVVIGTGTYTGTSGGWASFTLSVPVTMGDQFAIEPISTSGAYWLSNTGANYAGGDAWNICCGGFLAGPAQDKGFRTWVDADIQASVPEPAMLGLFGLGALGLGLTRRRRAA